MPPPQPHRPVKRKKPPTFQHHPVERAKKLKRSWVETQKIKSQWKAQKRKEGIIAARTQLDPEADADEDATGESHEDPQPHIPAIAAPAGSDGEETEESGDEVPSVESPPRRAAISTKGKASQTDARRKERDGQGSLRDLQRAAYSRSSLHTHKSDPTPRQGGSSSRGRGGHGANRGRGRGQPDMGLRMKAMLEKIKRDLT